MVFEDLLDCLVIDPKFIEDINNKLMLKMLVSKQGSFKSVLSSLVVVLMRKICFWTQDILSLVIIFFILLAI